ncbi:MAG: DUF4279 domain-containing protein [Alphaproteobacteria bacterium]
MKAMPEITPDRDGPADHDDNGVSAPAKRFEIVLLIHHPNIDPGLVTAALGIKPYRSWKAGEPRFTPKGRPLPGTHQISRWNYVFRYKSNKGFASQIDSILERLLPAREFFLEINDSGGTAQLYLMLPGDQNLGDELDWKILGKFVDLRLAFSVETFPDWG